MTDDEFWRLIDLIDTRLLDAGNERVAVHKLTTCLSGKSEKELIEFEETLAQKLYAIDGEVYARNAGESGGSDDGFLYLRLYVVAKGREFYESVRTDPTKTPDSIDQWCEWLLSTYKDAWASISGKSPSDWPYAPSVSYETASNPDLWPR